MDFIHLPYLTGETIAAIATPPGEGGISIIRISGTHAVEIGSRVFSGPVSSYASHTAHVGRIIDREGNSIDTALVLVMHAPRSYTGEDTIEIQCHGGLIASQKVLTTCIEAGARAAQPGEFTFRAFLHGKIDLSQAEATQSLISATHERAFTAAARHLEGALSKKVVAFQEELIRLTAILEAWVDFPEEGILFMSVEQFLGELEVLRETMHHLVETFTEGRKLVEGISLCIVGPPNAGKSSLMNALLGKERAIVTPIAGTTRDLIEGELLIKGHLYTLIDTAGIRDTEESIEQEGIRRAKRAAATADIILCVLDVSKPLEEEEREILRMLPLEKTLVIWNKIDLIDHPPPALSGLHTLALSAERGVGIEELKEKIDALVWQGKNLSNEEVVITALRHKIALAQAVESIEKVMQGIQQGISPEFLTADARQALAALGMIRGINISEEILSSIFAQFCIGK